MSEQEPLPPSFVVAGMPMYNEEETIGTVVTTALRHVDAVICIDDGSSDSSARIAEACGAIVYRHRSNRGYGAALKTLFIKVTPTTLARFPTLKVHGNLRTLAFSWTK